MKSTLNYASRLSLVEHFSGRADLSTLYPFKDQHSDWHRQSGFYERWALFHYDETYHNEDFFGRCMAYMVLMEKRCFFISSLFYGDDLIQKIWSMYSGDWTMRE